MALEINTEWNAYNKPDNDVAKKEDTIYIGPKNKALGKHVYKNNELRWNPENTIINKENSKETLESKIKLEA